MNKIKKYLFEIISLLVMIGVTVYTSNRDNVGYNQLMNICGLLYVFSARREDWFYPILGLVFATMYSSQMLDLKILGEAYFNMCITIPMLLVGLYQNLTNISDDKIHFKDRTIDVKPLCYISILIEFSLYYLLKSNGSVSPLIDSLSTTFAFMGTLLLNMRYNKQSFYFWSLANATNLILHITRENYALCIVFTIYLINGLLVFKKK